MAKAKWAVVLGLASIVACSRENPVGPRPEETVDATGRSGDILAAIECTISAGEESMSCGPATSSLVPASIVGGQHRFIRLTSTNVGGDPILSADVTVQNLTLLRMATADGTTPDPNGVRVFFHSGPTNGVTVQNPDGFGTFTGSNQPYFEYSGAELGADQILEQGEVSSPQTWQFNMTGCTTGPPCTFSFTVFVSAITPDETPSARTVSLTQIDAGGFHSCGIGDDGKTYCWGLNTAGQVGDGTTTNRTTPRAVNTAETFVQVTAGDLHTCALNAAGAAFCWGEGGSGRLGNGATGDQSSPVAVNQTTSGAFASISAGGNHTCALTTAGVAYCWGADGDGQLGNGAGGGQTTPGAVTTVLTFASISAGGTEGFPMHTCAVTATGDAHCWGDDSSGQLGNGATTGDQHTPSPVDQTTSGAFASISAGTLSTCAVTGSGSGYCWGGEDFGRLGNGSTSGTEPSPVAVSGGHTFSGISAGRSHTCGVVGGSGYCWGSDGNGQLGNGPTTGVQSTPQLVSGGIVFAGISVGGFHTTGRQNGGQAYGWGFNSSGQVGDGRTTDQNAPVFVAATTN